MSRTRTDGLTLLEVLVAMGLLGTLLVSLLAAHSRYAVRLETASARLRIAAEVEKLLSTWQLKLGTIPTNDQGELLVGEETYRWKTVPKERVLDEDFMIGQVEFSVVSLDEQTTYLKLELVVPTWSQ